MMYCGFTDEFLLLYSANPKCFSNWAIHNSCSSHYCADCGCYQGAYYVVRREEREDRRNWSNRKRGKKVSKLYLVVLRRER